MNIQNIEKKEKNMATFEVKVPADVFDNAVNEVYKKNKSQLYVAGFRKGKAPRAVIEGMYGKDVFYPEAIETLAQEAFEAGRAECGFECVGAPSLLDQQINDDKELIYTFEVAVYPEVVLGQYKGLEVPQNHETFDESKVDEEMRNVQKRNARLIDVEREAKLGDHTTIDFAGFIDGEQFDGGTAENYDIELGSNTFVPGFEEQLVGVKAGDEKDLDITFPEDYHKDLAGKAVVFKVKVHEVKEKEIPALDDEFAKDVSEFDTLKDLKADLKKKITAEREETVKRAFEDALMEQVAENITADVPDAMVEAQSRQFLDNFKMQLAQQGLQYDQYMKATGMDEAQLLADAKEPALKQVRMDLAMAAIIKEENIDATDEEVEAEFQRMADQYGMDLETVKKYLQAEQVKDQLKSQKAIAVVVDSATAVKAEKKPAKRTAAAKKADTAKTAAKKSAARKPAAAKTAAKKPAAKKETASKAAAKTTSTRKTAAKKTVASKAKKPAGKE